jgi:UDP-GlcNAc:undecaprenyl-phosphate GlcNAc-1-phosphate transferase
VDAAAISAIVAGAALGFLIYNFNPATIFMGDTGSMFLGYSCAVLMILMGEQQLRWFLAGLIMFALPVLDTALAFARRYVNGRPLFSADKFHFHHQLVSRGFSVKQTVLISYSLAIGFVLLGAFIVVMRTRYAGAFYLVIFGCIIVTAYKMGMVHEKPRAVPRSTLNESDAIQPVSEATQASDVLEITTPVNVSGNLSASPNSAATLSRDA